MADYPTPEEIAHFDEVGGLIHAAFTAAINGDLKTGDEFLSQAKTVENIEEAVDYLFGWGVGMIAALASAINETPIWVCQQAGLQRANIGEALLEGDETSMREMSTDFFDAIRRLNEEGGSGDGS